MLSETMIISLNSIIQVFLLVGTGIAMLGCIILVYYNHKETEG